MASALTERAERVLKLARRDAVRREAGTIEPQHLLLALLEEPSGLAADALHSLRADRARIRAEVERRIAGAPRIPTYSGPAQSAASALVIERARQEARALGHQHVGTEHLLLALVAETPTLAASTLADLGIVHAEVRQAIVAATRERPPRRPRMVLWLCILFVGLGTILVWLSVDVPAHARFSLAELWMMRCGGSLLVIAGIGAWLGRPWASWACIAIQASALILLGGSAIARNADVQTILGGICGQSLLLSAWWMGDVRRFYAFRSAKNAAA